MSDRHAIESPTVLANRGIPVLVYRTEPYTVEGSETPAFRPVTREVFENGEPKQDFEFEHKFVSLNAVTMAFLEDHYGSMQEWNEALGRRPFSVVLTTLSALWREPKGQVGARLLEGQMDEYVVSLQVAAYRAQGVPVDDLGKLLKRGMEEAHSAVRLLSATVVKMAETPVQDTSDEAIEKMLTPAPSTSDSPGPTG